MYQAVLTIKYLRSKVMPLFAACGVALCVLMVLVVWSVMTGFLSMLINTGRTLAGDVSIGWPGTGFAHYEELIADLEKDPLVEAACPKIESFGSITRPGGSPRGVLVIGVDGPRFAKATLYDSTLWWKPVETPLPKDTRRADPRLPGENHLNRGVWETLHRNGLALTRLDPKTGQPVPAIVPGIHVTGLNYRDRAGFYEPLKSETKTADGHIKIEDVFLPLDTDTSIGLTVFPIDSQGRPYEAHTRSMPVANEFQSGVYSIDESMVLVNLEALQVMLRMNEGLRVAEGAAAPAPSGQSNGESFATPQPTNFVKGPARVTHVIVRGKSSTNDPAAAKELRERVRVIYDAFAARHPGQVPATSDMEFMTWEDQNATFINAVRTERTLMLFLFMIISVTAVLLVLSIFWSMVREKTQDIGVLRSMGASRAGVAGLWVMYGLSIGFVGACVGLTGSYFIIKNINPIHDALGEAFGIVVWDPRVYYFTLIPNEVRPLDAALVFIGGVLSCGLGALVPALRAAWMSPVAALRNE